ncbi:DUF11 domain-containing protein [Ottowia thiooxydans]|uniref:DUF7927 domain-containing protein n=1 Tax=Ottowia thiooxydans TaxID=219182 RepID=UPI00146A8F19|nr:DUF11 domain-containing protein [Ottowia thiooxydans]
MTISKSSNPPSGQVVTPGQLVQYTLTVNVANGPTRSPVVLNDLLDSQLTFSAIVTNPAGFVRDPATNSFTLPVGAANGSRSITYSALVSNTASGAVSNFVSATGGGDPGRPDPVCATPSGCRTAHSIDPVVTISKSSNPPSGQTVTPGQLVQYTLTVNVANGPTRSPVVLNDLLDSQLTFSAIVTNPAGFVRDPATNSFTLAAGAANGSRSITYSALVSNTASGAVSNFVSATGGGDPGRPDPVCATPSGCRTAHSIDPVVTISKSSNPPSGQVVTPGQLVQYTLTVNVANGPTRSPVVLNDLLDSQLTFSAIVTNPAGFVRDPATNSFTLAAGAANGSRSITYSALVSNTASGAVSNFVSATGGGDPGRPDPVCATPSGCRTAHSIDPVVTISKSSNPPSGQVVTPGQLVQYTLTVNVANGPTRSPVVLNDLLDSQLTFSAIATNPAGFVRDPATNSFTLAAGAANGSRSITYSALVSNTASGAVSNFVSAMGGGDPGRPDPVCATPSGCRTAHSIDPVVTINKSSNPPSGQVVTPGQLVQYTLTVNVANGPTRSPVVLNDLLDSQLTFSAIVTNPAGFVRDPATNSFTLPVGAANGSRSITYSALVSNTASGAVSNFVSATGGGDPGRPDPVCATPSGCRTAHSIDPVVTISKSSNPASGQGVVPGQLVQYTLTVNVANGPTRSPVVLSDLLDSQLTFSAIVTNPAGFVRDPATNSFTLPVGAANGSRSITYSAVVSNTASGAVSNFVSATGGGDPGRPDPVCDPAATCRTTNPVDPLVTISKSSNPVSGQPVTPGQLVQYTLTVNVLNGPTRSPVVLSDLLDSQLTFDTIVTNTDGFVRDPATNTFTLPVGATNGSRSVTYSAMVSSTAGGAVSNFVSATGGGDPGRPDPTCDAAATCRTTNPIDPVVTISKSSNPPSGQRVLPGQLVQYTLTVNVVNGPTRSAVVLSDLLDSQLAFEAILANPADFVRDPATNTFTLPSGAANGSRSVTYSARVSNTASGAVSNFVSATGGGDPGRPDPTCDAAATCRTTNPVDPVVTIRKSSNPPSGETVQPGQLVQYTLTVNITNGPTRSAVVLNDLLDSKLRFEAIGANSAGFIHDPATNTFTLPSGETNGSRSVTYSARVANPASGTVSNFVSGTGGGDPGDPDPICDPAGACETTHAIQPRSATIEPVPANAPWALWLLGFLIVGFRLRRR